MNVIIMLGAPGSGKGTIGEVIVTKAQYTHVSTGDMLREALGDATDLGKEAEAYMKRGELVPDEIVMGLVENRLDAGGDGSRYMFDGFPRTLAQSERLETGLAARGGSLGHVFFLDVTSDIIIRRLTGRRTCKECGQIFNIVSMKPRQEGVCDSCGGELAQRPDDNEATIAKRLEVYGQETRELIAHYEKKGILRHIDGDRGRDDCAAEILGILGEQ